MGSSLTFFRLGDRNTIEHIYLYHLLFTQKISDGGIDGKISIHKTHLIAIPLGDVGDEISDTGESGVDCGDGFARAELGDFQLSFFSLFVGNELKVQVEFLKLWMNFL
ncbi:hypothetical protein ACFX13_035576 [Malus domestica]